LLPDGSASIDGWRVLLRAKLCRHGVTQMRTDAELALTLIAVGSLWRAPAQLLLGISYLLAGDLGVADAALAEAVEVAQDTGATVAVTVALAQQELARAQRLRPQATHALPYYAVQARLELIRAYLALADVAAAQTVFREVDDLLRWWPDLGILRDQANQLRYQLDHPRGELIGMTSLTTAELRLFPLLATHLTFREMGQHLYVSQHTVKSQADL
jgi:LuxR family maltose regulon positive regulatory protein